jgi:hypothetical protein
VGATGLASKIFAGLCLCLCLCACVCLCCEFQCACVGLASFKDGVNAGTLGLVHNTLFWTTLALGCIFILARLDYFNWFHGANNV